MGDKNKTMCKLCKDDYPDEHPEEFVALIKNATHYCRKCGRVSNEEKRLCKARVISDKA